MDIKNYFKWNSIIFLICLCGSFSSCVISINPCNCINILNPLYDPPKRSFSENYDVALKKGVFIKNVSVEIKDSILNYHGKLSLLNKKKYDEYKNHTLIIKAKEAFLEKAHVYKSNDIPCILKKDSMPYQLNVVFEIGEYDTFKVFHAIRPPLRLTYSVDHNIYNTKDKYQTYIPLKDILFKKEFLFWYPNDWYGDSHFKIFVLVFSQ